MLYDFLKIDKDSSKEFWLSHILIIVATVLGVYLAAISGFEQALKFEEVISDKDGYYLQQSMADELDDNIKNIKVITDKYLELGKLSEASLDDFVWNAMKFSPETFEIPSEILTAVRRYYSRANIMIKRITTKRINALDRKLVKEVLALGEALKKTTFPKIQQRLDTLKTSLESQGIAL